MSNTSDGLLSVVIPVYKAVDYLDQCVRSVLAQTYEHLEIILVDDGSPDDSGAMCDAWQRKDARIHAIHQDNKGISGARNTGLLHATGEYLLFIDNDDWIETDLAQRCITRLNNDHSDTVIFDYRYMAEDGSRFQPSEQSSHTHDQTIIDNVQAVDYLLRGILPGSPWSRITRRDIYVQNHIFFPEGRIEEDRATTYKVFGCCGSVSLLPQPLYNYRQRGASTSIQTSLTKQRFNDYVVCNQEMSAWMSTHLPQLLSTTQKSYMNGLIERLMFVYSIRKQLSQRQYLESRQLLSSELEKVTSSIGTANLGARSRLKILALQLHVLPVMSALRNLQRARRNKLRA